MQNVEEGRINKKNKKNASGLRAVGLMIRQTSNHHSRVAPLLPTSLVTDLKILRELSISSPYYESKATKPRKRKHKNREKKQKGNQQGHT